MICPSCGGNTYGDLEMCVHHSYPDALESANNRAMCDMLHRGKVPKRLALEEREALSELTE